jgi:Telomere resolvase
VIAQSFWIALLPALQSDLFPLEAEECITTAKELLGPERFISLGMGLMAVTGRRPAEIFFSASFAPLTQKLPFPAVIFSGHLKTRNAPGTSAPGTSFEPYPIPTLVPPKIVWRLSDGKDRIGRACRIGGAL